MNEDTLVKRKLFLRNAASEEDILPFIDHFVNFSTRHEKKTTRRFARISTFHQRDLDWGEQPRHQWNYIKLRRGMTHWYNLREAATMASSSKYKRVNGSVCRPSGYLSRFSEIIPRTPWLTIWLVPAGPHECKGRGTRW